MSKLEKLIRELCPDGVEYKKIKECTLKVEKIKWDKSEGTFQYIDLSSVDSDTHSVTNTTLIDRDNAPSRAQQIVRNNDVLFATTRPMLKKSCYIEPEFDNSVCSTGFCVLRTSSQKLNPRWLYHVIATSTFFEYVEVHQRGTSYPAISDKDLKEYRIPVPPLPVQEEIVRILDSFTALTVELTEELKAELVARKQQYEYYRSLTFARECVFSDFKNFCILSRGEYITKKDSKPGNIPVILGGQEPAYYIDHENHTGKAIVISRSGASAGFVSYWDEPIFVTDGFIIEAKEIADIRFLYHYFKNKQMELNRSKRGAGVPHVIGEIIKSIKIPNLPLAEQKRIVSILDRFDALCNDLTSGLPAEIAARQKQYEYYRDKLLTFKEKENV